MVNYFLENATLLTDAYVYYFLYFRGVYICIHIIQLNNEKAYEEFLKDF